MTENCCKDYILRPDQDYITENDVKGSEIIKIYKKLVLAPSFFWGGHHRLSPLITSKRTAFAL